MSAADSEGRDQPTRNRFRQGSLKAFQRIHVRRRTVELDDDAAAICRTGSELSARGRQVAGKEPEDGQNPVRRTWVRVFVCLCAWACLGCRALARLTPWLRSLIAGEWGSWIDLIR
jgi:hypothetical protein